MSSTSSNPQLPGFNLPLNCKPEKRIGAHSWSTGPFGFPNALDIADGYVNQSDVKREILMMRVMNSITDKLDWDKKVGTDSVVLVTAATFLKQHRFSKKTSSPSGAKKSLGAEKTYPPKMMDWIIKELQWKAEAFKETGCVTVFDVGVVKSDTAISPELQQALQKAVVPLEDIPEDQKDYHPGSQEQVLDLVHPSLFPVIFGRTRILPDRVIGLDTCLSSVGQGSLLLVPSEDDAKLPHRYGWRDVQNAYSRKFQWLPCDVEFTPDAGCRIVSYINNLHPVEHRRLYEIVEKIISQTIPIWNQTLAYRPFNQRRIQYQSVDYEDDGEDEPHMGDDEDDEEYYERSTAWWKARRIIQPEPEEFKPPNFDRSNLVDLQEGFSKQGLQVIVKLANIELTTDKPEYAGGSWHIEGQLNERICATAIYYYDSQNITQSTLAFRQRSGDDFQDVQYEQEQHGFLQAVYGFGEEVEGNGTTNVTQDLGSVVCQEGRLLTFPNVVQHRVLPFSLKDRTKPGHRKILALFLIDPHRRIISSANVPPQQEEWGRKRRELVDNLLSQNLPPELQNMVKQDLPSVSISMDEAKSHRLELMEERSVKAEANNSAFETGDFSLCEH
ncbi:uncharacterized protein N7482_001734 [Penicillium canariense]|uniref:Uncharacterized protein n=1 Tax=Penicillium canariense TaxID=189055 RepID=A0A9W9IGD3_9EURO|nr:uncharacterized protein N7482_001734 [Penicillium canariense]KAJ5175857.1 hypothetical protein N7482_001734 [Penicillium canariense]